MVSVDIGAAALSAFFLLPLAFDYENFLDFFVFCLYSIFCIDSYLGIL